MSVGMGLEIMRHRVRMLGGLVDIRRARTGGTRVLCVVPPS
jgi:signal transduction histidine kinase